MSENDGQTRPAARNKHHEMDSRWAWVTVAAIFINNLLMIGYQRSLGLLFLEIGERYNVSASQMSLIGGVHSALFSITVILVMTFVLGVTSERKSVLIGSVLIAFGVSINFVVTSFPLLVLMLGGLVGIGTAFAFGPSFVLMGKCFKRHLTLAIAVANTGVSVGGIVVPLITRAILDEFSFPGGMLLIGGVLSQMIVMACLYRPVPKVNEPVNDSDNNDVDDDVDVNRETDSTLRRGLEKSDVGHVFSREDLGNSTQTQTQNTLLGDNCTPKLKMLQIVSENNPYTVATYPSDSEGKDNSNVYSKHNADSNANSSVKTQNILNHKHPASTAMHSSCKSIEANNHEGFPNIFPDMESASHLHERCETYPESAEDGEIADRIEMAPLVRNLENVVTEHKLKQNEVPAGHAETTREKMSSSTMLRYASISDSLCISMTALDIFASQDFAANGNCLEKQKQNQHETCYHCRSKLGKMFDLSVFKSAVFWSVLLFQAFGLLMGSVGLSFLPPLAKEKGLSESDATLLLTLIGTLDIFSRILPGVIAHYKLMKPQHMVVISQVIIGTLCQFLSFFNTLSAMIGFCVVFGCLSGVFFSMSAAIVIEFMGLERFPVSFGFVLLFNGVSASLGYPIIGALKDATGSYVTSFYYLGITQFLSAASITSIPVLRWLQTKMKEKSKVTQQSETLA